MEQHSGLRRLVKPATGHHPGSCAVGTRNCGLHRWLLARANAKAASWRPDHHAHHPSGNAAAEPDRAPVADAAALAHRLFQPISIAVSDSSSDATTDPGEAFDGDAQPNRQRHGCAADATA